MEPRFICEYMPTVRKLAEQTRKLRPARLIIFIALAVLYFCYVVSVGWVFDYRGMWILYVLLGLFFLTYGLAMPEINAFLSIKRAEKDIGSYPVCNIAFGDSIEITEGTIKVLWEYGDIREVKRYKYTYVLLKNKRMGITIDPDSFTLGTFEDFKQFLREKCPNISIPE